MTDHRARKRFGQHFLTDNELINAVIGRMNLQPEDKVVEIGPGLGALTYPLLAKAKKLTAIELDRDLIPILNRESIQYGELDLHQGDVLRFDFNEICPKGHKLRVTGNLPYNISTPLLFKLFEQLTVFQDMVFMVQKEVANRLAAGPGGRNYGRLSIMAQLHCRITHWFHVPPTSFDPPPKVDSAIIYLVPHAEPMVSALQVTQINQVVTQAFSQRRKTCQNALKQWLSSEQIQNLGIDPKARPEMLSCQDYIDLANTIFSDKMS